MDKTPPRLEHNSLKKITSRPNKTRHAVETWPETPSQKKTVVLFEHMKKRKQQPAAEPPFKVQKINLTARLEAAAIDIDAETVVDMFSKLAI